MIISVLNQKGGVGKTTLSIHIASALALMNKSVLLIDADTQRSALDWAATRQKDALFNVAGISSASIHKEVRLFRPRYDFIIIDGPPRIHDVARAIIATSDLILIPAQPSPYDIWAADEIVKLIKEVKETLQDLKKIDAAFVINRKIKNTVISREVSEALSNYDLPVLTSTLHQRVTFAETAAQGSSAVEEEPTSPAAQEINDLITEILDRI